jgi:hypothetical protein
MWPSVSPRNTWPSWADGCVKCCLSWPGWYPVCIILLRFYWPWVCHSVVLMLPTSSYVICSPCWALPIQIPVFINLVLMSNSGYIFSVSLIMLFFSYIIIQIPCETTMLKGRAKPSCQKMTWGICWGRNGTQRTKDEWKFETLPHCLY